MSRRSTSKDKNEPVKEDMSWLVDYIEGFMKSPTWINPILEFIKEKYMLFVDATKEGDNPVSYQAVHM